MRLVYRKNDEAIEVVEGARVSVRAKRNSDGSVLFVAYASTGDGEASSLTAKPVMDCSEDAVFFAIGKAGYELQSSGVCYLDDVVEMATRHDEQVARSRAMQAEWEATGEIADD